MSEHEHVFRRARVTDDDGAVIEGGRRCSCGIEVVGDGPLSVNAQLVRSARNFNRAVTEMMTRIGQQLEASRRRRFP